MFKTPQIITLSGTQLELSDTTGTETITGPRAGVTVSGGGHSRILQVDGTVAASISGLTITGGVLINNSAGVDGGGLYNLGGTVTLTNCTVTGNYAEDSGGGMDSLGGTTQLTNCTVSNNVAAGDYSGGGGVDIRGGTATLTNCSLTGNYASSGDGLWNSGMATLTGCACQRKHRRRGRRME